MYTHTLSIAVIVYASSNWCFVFLLVSVTSIEWLVCICNIYHKSLNFKINVSFT